MEVNHQLKIRTNLHAGQLGPAAPGNNPGGYGWYWMQGGYIARPGRPMKEFTGWWLGGNPQYYYPLGGAGNGNTFGAPGLGGSESGDGSIAPPAPN